MSVFKVEKEEYEEFVWRTEDVMDLSECMKDLITGDDFHRMLNTLKEQISILENIEEEHWKKINKELK